MVVILGLPRVACLGGASHFGGLPGIAPLRLSGKKTAPFPASG
jgi:hypothetical protein